MSKRKDITNKIHNSILPIKYSHTKNTHAIWECKCFKCNQTIYVSYSNITSGNTKSCTSCEKRKILTEQDKEIRTKYELGVPVVGIAKDYNVTRDTIYNSLRRTKNK